MRISLAEPDSPTAASARLRLSLEMRGPGVCRVCVVIIVDTASPGSPLPRNTRSLKYERRAEVYNSRNKAIDVSISAESALYKFWPMGSVRLSAAVSVQLYSCSVQMYSSGPGPGPVLIPGQRRSATWRPAYTWRISCRTRVEFLQQFDILHTAVRLLCVR